MRDLELWRDLQGEPGEHLLAPLAELASLPLEARMPYLARLPRLLSDPDPELRQRALKCLSGATGWSAFDLLVKALDDESPEVLTQALLSLETSARNDPARWAHAVFHKRPLVRHLACDYDPRWAHLNLFLLDDPQCSQRVQDRFPSEVPVQYGPAILQWLQVGSLPTALGRAALKVKHLVYLFDHQGADNTKLDLLELFWDDEPDSVRFWGELEGWLNRKRNAGYHPLFEQLVTGLCQRSRGRLWPESVCQCLVSTLTHCLLDTAVPLQARRTGLKALYRVQREALAPAQMLELLESELIRHEDGSYNLWALGAALFLSPQPQLVLSSLDFQELVEATVKRPEDVAFLFLAPGSEPSRQVNFAHRLGQETGCQVQIAAGLLAGPLRYHQVKKQLTRVPPLRLAATLLELEKREGFRLSDSREARITQGLSRLLSGHFAPALNLLLDRFSTGPGLSVSLLSELSRGVEPAEFVKAARELSLERLQWFLLAIDECAGFHYPSEGLLAQEFESSSDPEVAEWCRRRRQRPAPALVRPSSYQPRQLSKAEGELIANCPAGGLGSALSPTLEAPSLGLASCLKRRSAVFNVRAVLALVGCHDELDQVADLLADFSEGRSLMKEVVAHWSYQPELPLHGHCWLHRFDFHIDRAEEWVDGSTSQLEGLVERASRLRSPVAGSLWKMIARLFSRWWCRDPGKLFNTVNQAILDRLVGALSTAHQREAAVCLLRMWQTGCMSQALVDLKPRLSAMLCDLEKETREYLAGFLNSRGVPGPTRKRRTGDTRPELIAAVQACTSLEELATYAVDRQGDIVAEAVLRLLDFGEAGAEILLKLMLRPSEDASAPAHAPLLAEWVGLWPDGQSRRAVLARVWAREFEPEVLFAAALSFLENGEPTLEPALWAAHEVVAVPWFTGDFWERLVRAGADEQSLCFALADCPHPHAYLRAVEFARKNKLLEPLVRFLECDYDRQQSLRLEVARFLWEHGDRRGFPLLFGERMTAERAGDTDLCGGDLADGVRSVLLAGQPCVLEKVLVKWLLGLPDEPFEELAPLVLHQSRRSTTCQALLSRLPHTPRRQSMLSRLAGISYWGMKVGRQLTGRLFQVEMLGGDDLGYTRLEESRIFVNPLPLLRGQQYGQEVLEGLILHELGHHIYHRGEEEKKTWEQADKEGIFDLLNLVSDEHLERNLRSKDPMYDRCLKRLCAFAFLHNRREVRVESLLLTLQARAFAVLSGSRLEVARKDEHVGVRSGELFSNLEQQGSSFGRFARALRMGRGNRWDDEKVGRGLSLFGNDFRDLKLAQQLPIARELREIFGRECELLQVLSQDGACEPDKEEVLVLGEGLTPEEMRRELERMKRDAGEGSGDGPSTYWINKCADPSFPSLSHLVPVAFDPVAEREYVRQVARHARRLREVFQKLGLSYEPQRYRIRGHRVDPARITQAVVRGEMRILQSRQLRFKTDMFLGVLVDCSGSMQGESIHKARLFATLVAQAARGLKGLDLRVLGFNDTTLFDAGDAQRCAAHNIQVSGGNNDAGALAYAASLARASRRRARLLVMISDGLPTACSVQALKGLVEKLSRKEHICCAQVAVRPLKEVCFPHYIELQGDAQLPLQVAEFGRIIARLTYKTLR